ncbi:MAG: RAMP superfamily CRISPR-associated protein [Thermodesulfobacteriota bacterium]
MGHHIRLDLQIVFTSRWHAGSGESSLMTDRLVRRNGRNRPFIPAATLKGIVRQSCEKLSRTRGFPDPSDPHQSDLTEQGGFVPSAQMTSPVDRLFGTRFEPGGLFFRDAYINDGVADTLVQHRVARHRVLGTAKEKQLFTTEYSIPEVLCARIDGWHKKLVTLDDDNPPYEYCLLVAGILAVDKIGGDKSTGSGWLKQIGLKSGQYNGSALDLDKALDLLDLVTWEDYSELRGER